MKRPVVTTILISALLFVALVWFLILAKSPSYSLDEARDFASTGDYSKAVEAYAQYCSRNGNDLAAGFEFAGLRLAHGEDAEGLQILRTMLDRAPDDVGRNQIRIEIMKYSAAATARMNDSAGAAMSALRYEAAKGFYGRALTLEQMAVSAWPQPGPEMKTRIRDARVNYGYAGCLSGDPATADGAVAAEPEAEMALTVRLLAAARKSFENRDYENARTIYRDAVRRLDRCAGILGPRSGVRTEANYSLATTELYLGSDADALQHFRAALAAAPAGFYLIPDITATIARLSEK